MWHTILVVYSIVVAAANECVRRRSEYRGDNDGHYCVCNATYCDIAPTVVRPNNPAKYSLITSSKSGLRFNVTSGLYENVDTKNDLENLCKKYSPAPPGRITVHPQKRYQKIIGIGGAVTDSTSFNIYSLSKEAADNLLKSYFDRSGIAYSLIRAPMGPTDFSWRLYSYAMKENDTTLSSFSLQEEDYNYKIPVIKRAQQLRHDRIKILTAPWSAPTWMRIDNDYMGGGWILPKYRQLWADYFVRYILAYRDFGIEFWSVSVQNEPVSFFDYPNAIGMVIDAEEERDWIINYLSPALKTAGLEHTNILIIEGDRSLVANWSRVIFENAEARKAVGGVAIHWYSDKRLGPDVYDEVQRQFPEMLLMYTESCLANLTAEYISEPVMLGSWDRGERYAKSIIETVSHWIVAWVDWNIALDLNGGPNCINNYADSPIIVNKTADEFYKQPMFYALGHFSKYVLPGSVRIGSTSKNTEGIDSVAFSTPDNGTVLVILNRNEAEKEVLIRDFTKGATRIKLAAKSINTMMYW